VQSLRLALRGAMAVAAMVTATASFADRAHAQGRLETRYVAKIGGIAVGSGTWIVDIGPDRYSATLTGQVTSLLHLLTNGEGAVDAHGRVQGGRLMTGKFAAEIRSILKSYDVRMEVDNGTVKELTTIPAIEPGPDRVPIGAEHRRSITDPLSAALIPAPAGGAALAPAACERRLPIFDGRERFDVALSFKRMETVKAETGYEGPAIVCAMTYRPVAGHVPGQPEVRFLGHERGMDVWLAPIAGTRFLAPFRITVPTVFGLGVLEATRFESVATAVARTLPRPSAPRLAPVSAPAAAPPALPTPAPASMPAATAAAPAPTPVAMTTTAPAAPGPAVVDGGRRIALVIGNAAYVGSTPLDNPANDARNVARALRDLGFEVIEGTDLDRAGMERVVREFLHNAPSARLTLLYYAGHGMQVDGKNYLIPIDAKLTQSSDLGFETMEVDKILSGLDDGTRANIIILDACRDNPLAQRFAHALGPTRSVAVAPGLAASSAAGPGTLIAFATGPGQFAFDDGGPDNDSPFTAALIKHIRTPGIEVNQMLARVRIDVAAATANKQVPWANSSLLGEVYLAGPPKPPNGP